MRLWILSGCMNMNAGKNIYGVLSVCSTSNWRDIQIARELIYFLRITMPLQSIWYGSLILNSFFVLFYVVLVSTDQAHKCLIRLLLYIDFQKFSLIIHFIYDFGLKVNYCSILIIYEPRNCYCEKLLQNYFVNQRNDETKPLNLNTNDDDNNRLKFSLHSPRVSRPTHTPPHLIPSDQFIT